MMTIRSLNMQVQVVPVMRDERESDVNAFDHASGTPDSLSDFLVNVVLAILPARAGEDDIRVVFLPQLCEYLCGRNVRRQLVADDPLYFSLVNDRIESFVGKDEAHDFLFEFQAVELRVSGHVICAELIRFLTGATTTKLDPHVSENRIESVV